MLPTLLSKIKIYGKIKERITEKEVNISIFFIYL